MSETYDDILEPRKKYFQELERTHLENVKAYFEDLVNQSQVDAQANKVTCDKIRGVESEIKALKRKEVASKGKFLAVILVFFALLFAGLIMFAYANITEPKMIWLMIIGVLVSIGSIALMIFSIIRRTKAAKYIAVLLSNKTSELETLKNKAYGQMAALNNLYEWNIYNILMNKTTPLIKMDRIFDMEKYNQMVDQFKWNDDNDVHKSTVLAQSGSILGNPFVICREYRQTFVNHTYTGSIRISWTERVPNGKGGFSTRTRHETLTASVTKLKPDYNYQTKLVFASEAAPDLIFSRNPQSHGYSESELKAFFKRAEKRVDEYSKKHPNFTPLGNDEFEDFFGGLDRNHEVQYRLLFTPLAQKSMLDILKNPTPYGDDFSFYKYKMINTIISNHSQTIDYDGSPSIFYHYDLEMARENFINRNMSYFKGVFFDLAPLLSIPLYQQFPTNDYIFNKDIGSDYSRHLSEMEANRYNINYFKPDECVTPIILKSKFIKQIGGAHAVNMQAFGFKTEEHVDYFTRMGGDGRLHEIPVHWLEYIPISKTTPFVVQATDITRRQYYEINSMPEYSQFLNKNVVNNAILCSRGLFSFINRGNSYYPDELNNIVEKILNK